MDWSALRRHRAFWPGVALAALLVLALSCLRLARIEGPSDAPGQLWGDLVAIWVGPFSPRPGQLVLVDLPDRGQRATKRVLAGPGASVEGRGNHLVVAGVPLTYRPLERHGFDWVPARNLLGTVIEEEHGAGFVQLIAHTPGLGPHASFGPVTVPTGHYFLIGDNRDRSEDSRSFGPVPRSAIRGRVLFTLRRNRRS
ncbi:MAG TPA: signal peptidase I [Candidatus Polarisedimenticolaceae bacterium]|nr:signal peptidase I [Candidatus Polarisedimenticolaceae bacterium]